MIIRHDWTCEEATALYRLPFNDLLFQAQTVHRRYFNPNRVQLSTLLSIKTGACPEDCKYCSQSGHYRTDLKKEKLLDKATVLAAAKRAKDGGATRFCMAAAWRGPSAKDMQQVTEMITAVKALGLETCASFGTVSLEQSQALAGAGLDYFNHNLDTSPEHYDQIITTRTYAKRLETLDNVAQSGIKICCGGIVGLGEGFADRVSLLVQLANLPEHPGSVPINQLVKIAGTPLENTPDMDPLELIRTIALARILMPKAYVRLAAGRAQMNDATQALAFFAGVNSIFKGDTLLTVKNPKPDADHDLFQRLGLTPESLNGNTGASCSSYE